VTRLVDRDSLVRTLNKYGWDYVVLLPGEIQARACKLCGNVEGTEHVDDCPFVLAHLPDVSAEQAVIAAAEAWRAATRNYWNRDELALRDAVDGLRAAREKRSRTGTV
jgi:hypothetical protein